MTSKEIKRKIMQLEREYYKQYAKEQEIEQLKKEADEAARLERIKDKLPILNCAGKPITNRKKICDYDCQHCHIICSSDESDTDWPELLQEYKCRK